MSARCVRACVRLAAGGLFSDSFAHNFSTVRVRDSPAAERASLSKQSAAPEAAPAASAGAGTQGNVKAGGGLFGDSGGGGGCLFGEDSSESDGDAFVPPPKKAGGLFDSDSD